MQATAFILKSRTGVLVKMSIFLGKKNIGPRETRTPNRRIHAECSKHLRCRGKTFLISNVLHYSDVIMSAMASQITGVSIVYSIVCSCADQRKHQSSASLAFVRGIYRSPVNSPHKEPVTRKMSPFDDIQQYILMMILLFRVYECFEMCPIRIGVINHNIKSNI